MEKPQVKDKKLSIAEIENIKYLINKDEGDGLETKKVSENFSSKVEEYESQTTKDFALLKDIEAIGEELEDCLQKRFKKITMGLDLIKKINEDDDYFVELFENKKNDLIEKLNKEIMENKSNIENIFDKLSELKKDYNLYN